MNKLINVADVAKESRLNYSKDLVIKKGSKNISPN